VVAKSKRPNNNTNTPLKLRIYIIHFQLGFESFENGTWGFVKMLAICTKEETLSNLRILALSCSLTM